MDTLTIDCGVCRVRGPACSDCAVTALLGPIDGVQLNREEQAALGAMAASGLLPPLRLVRSVPESEVAPEVDPWDAFALDEEAL